LTQKSGLRIFALMTDAFGGHGGIAQYNRDLLAALAGCDGVHEVVVLPRAGQGLRETPSGIHQLKPIQSRVLYTLAALRAVRQHGSFDVVFCGHLFMVPLAALVAKLGRARLWVQVHGVEAWQELSGLRGRAVSKAALVTSVSRYTRRQLLGWVGIDPARVKVLPNTVDPRYRPGPKRPDLLVRHGATGKKILMTVSRLAGSERYKGQDRVIQVLPRLRSDHPDITYLIVGDGDDRPRLEALALECGVAEQVTFTGRVSDDELPDYYRLADVFVMPSTGEGFGIVFLEAMASGANVIGGNQDGTCDPLADGALGSLIAPENLDDLENAIRSALARRPLDGSNGNRFSSRLFAEQIGALVQSSFISSVGDGAAADVRGASPR
jgi:phosphatidyl-myo-inositol dimannoside synthase